MSFWGVEVKPGKPYTHPPSSERRLRLSQATLGLGNSTNKSTLQCNVGNKSPILLCHLTPNASETCHLELEFEEVEDVIFSVVGKRSIHLSGYYPGGGHSLGEDELESYGEDIADTDDSHECSYSDEDDYESDFIDDDDDEMEMFPSSRRHKSSVVIEELEDDVHPSNGNANRRRLKKKHQVSDSDDGQKQLVVKRNSSLVSESEDEDGFPISFSSRKENVVKDSEANSNQESDDLMVEEEWKKAPEVITVDDKTIRETSEPGDTQLGGKKNEKSKKKKKAKGEKPLETTSQIPAEKPESTEPVKNQDDNEVDGQKEEGAQAEEANGESKRDGADETSNDGKAKKKKKKAKKGKSTEAGPDVSAEKTEDKAVENTDEAANGDDKMDQGPPVLSEVDPLVIADDTSAKPKKKKNKKKRAKEDGGSDAAGGEVADVNQSNAKKLKKENKNNDKASSLSLEEQANSEVTKSGSKTRSYPNGLVIEELSMGKPDGAKATPGRKVFVNYIGKLKDGTIFDSTVGKRPFSFRLGTGQVIKGWDVGVNGMRIGDKRRLTVPPSYGYGQKKVGPIPPNSWLSFDVELVSVK